MKNVTVKLNTTDDALNFVRTVCRYPYRMNLRWDNYQISAKSVLGVIGLSTGECVDLCIDSMDTGSLMNDISGYIVQ